MKETTKQSSWLFGSIWEQINECNNINKENSIKTLKTTTRNTNHILPFKVQMNPILNLIMICGDLGDKGNLAK